MILQASLHRRTHFALLGAVLQCLLPTAFVQSATPANSELKRVLVIDKNSVRNSVVFETRDHLNSALLELGDSLGFEVEIFDRFRVFPTDMEPQLKGVQLVILNNNEGAAYVIPPEVRKALEEWVRTGGTLLAMRWASAFVTQSEWPFLVDGLVESFYGPHAWLDFELQLDPKAMAGGRQPLKIPEDAAIRLRDQVFSFRHSPRDQPGVTVFLTMDESSIDSIPASGYGDSIPGPMGSDHPLVWVKTVDQGKVIHNSLGQSGWPDSSSNAYEQQDGFLKKLLYRLLRYGAGDYRGCPWNDEQRSQPFEGHLDCCFLADLFPAALFEPDTSTALKPQAAIQSRTFPFLVRSTPEEWALRISGGQNYRLFLHDTRGKRIEYQSGSRNSKGVPTEIRTRGLSGGLHFLSGEIDGRPVAWRIFLN